MFYMKPLAKALGNRGEVREQLRKEFTDFGHYDLSGMMETNRASNLHTSWIIVDQITKSVSHGTAERAECYVDLEVKTKPGIQS